MTTLPDQGLVSYSSGVERLLSMVISGSSDPSSERLSGLEVSLCSNVEKISLLCDNNPHLAIATMSSDRLATKSLTSITPTA